MHIKKLEITGFKSFVDRTVIHFDHDVIGIVGPNGCGKSNIVDAIRWCMGEQSAKHLRGRAMEDVIFSGSESRGAAGLAEVTLTFDNTDPEIVEALPPEFRDYPEISVTRRLFRDGTSEYLINKTQVRLRDVTELFLGTGVGTKAYSIVEQGRIGQIVSARPEDRRLFIEEAAGVTKYKQRKRQAERKMELTRQNLLRLTDIVSEIERTRSSLKRQVAKAERFLEYRNELDDLVLHESSHKLLELIVVGRVERDGLATATTELERARSLLVEAETALEVTRGEAQTIEARSDAASQSAFEADNDVSTLHAEIERSRDRLTHLEQRLAAAGAEQAEIVERVSALSAERTELMTRVTELDNDERARAADAENEGETLEGLRSHEAAADAEVQGLRDQAAEATTHAATARARLEGLKQRIDEARNRRDRLTGEQSDQSEELGTLKALRHALEHSVTELAEGKRLTVAEREELEREMDQLRRRQLDAEREVDVAKNELGLGRSRLRALEDLHRRLEGVGSGVKALLSQGDSGVLGLVADRIEAPEALTSALAGLLGDRLQYVVVSDPVHGLELLDELKRSERGRASVIGERPRYVAGSSRAPMAGELDGCLGRLVDQLTYAAEDEALVRALVGDAVLAHDAPSALSIARQRPGSTVVALDGTVVRSDGVISGGSGDDVASGMVEQKREMRFLGQEVERLNERCTRAVAAHTELKARMVEVGTALDRARQDVHQGELDHVTAQKDLARTQSEIERIEARRRSLEAELAEVDGILESAADAEAQSGSQLSELEAQLEHLGHLLGKAEAHAETWKQRVSAQAALVTERKVRLAQVREQAEAARAAHERVENSIAELETRLSRLDQEMREAATLAGETAAHIVLARATRIEADARASATHQELAEARTLLDEVRIRLAEGESGLKTLRDELGALDQVAKRHELGLQRLELEQSHLESTIRDRFRGLELGRVVGDYHCRPPPDAEHRRRIDELSQLIDRMGPVNLDAKAEYDDAERRFVELSAQKIDIERALDELERAIKHMNRESRRRFKETFEAVNELFKQTFARMFRGGRAES